MFCDNVSYSVSEIKNRGDMIYHNLTDEMSFYTMFLFLYLKEIRDTLRTALNLENKGAFYMHQVLF